MNKNDIKLIAIILVIFLVLFLVMKINKKTGTTAKVYYESELILTIDLTIDKKYTVKGYNGDVEIEVKNNKIRVIQENSPYNICSKQGYISSSIEAIICLPNKIVIKIEDEVKLDGVVR